MYARRHTCSGALRGWGTLILVAEMFCFVLGAGTFFLSEELPELLNCPCPLLSLGLCLWTEAFSSVLLGGDFGCPSFGNHLFSSYLNWVWHKRRTINFLMNQTWNTCAMKFSIRALTLHEWNSQSQLCRN